MQISKWGNSLAIRLPAVVVKELELKEGDQIEVHVKGDRELEIARDHSREEALERVRKMRRPLPHGFKLNREELHRRGARGAASDIEL
jgi:antitoxin MazE